MNWKTIKTALVGCSLSFGLINDAGAAQGSNLTVSKIGVVSSIAWVEVIGTLSQPCASAALNGFAFDYSTNKGKAILQLLTAAQLSGKRFNIVGDGTCISVPRPGAPAANLDSISYLVIVN